MEPLAKRLRNALPGELPEPDLEQGVARISHPDPLRFWSHLLDALEGERSSALMNPHWPEAWRDQLGRSAGVLPPGEGPLFLVPTSGSSQLPKFCIHDPDTLTCAAIGYAQQFGTEGIIHSVNVLPQHHVGGFMPVFRSAECGGKVHFADYQDPTTFRKAPFPLDQASLSVVPTQLGRMRGDEALVRILKSFALVLVGGAACPPDILDWARREGIRLAPCYGSTETAAMVTVMDPESFASGISGVGCPLPHARIQIDSEERILVDSGACLRQYHPAQEGLLREPWPTGDLGHIDEDGHLHIHGRADRVIISGGEKIHPELVESAALATGLVTAVRCVGAADADWGQRVELTAVAARPDLNVDSLRQSLSKSLPPFAVPKVIHFTDEIPTDSMGKVTDSSV
ncbi:MAG: AMP-binding protein [Puniceicoccaceae bacterium]